MKGKIISLSLILSTVILLAGCGNAVVSQAENLNTDTPAVIQEVKDTSTPTPVKEMANPNTVPTTTKEITPNIVVPTPAEEAAKPTTEKTFTLADISSHNSETDCWMAIDGKVYNVTEYVSMHNPAIADGCGIDATSLFGSVGKHLSPQIQALLGQYIIGTLK